MTEQIQPRVATLHLLRRPGASLADALAAARAVDPEGYALLYSPAELLLLSLAEVDLSAWAGLDAPYEARFFDQVAEVRWVEGDGPGAGAVILSEKPIALDGWVAAEPRTTLTLERTYLLAPQVVETVRDLGAEKPAPDPPDSPPEDNRYLAVAAREYLAREDALGTVDYGNVGLLAERLTGFVETRVDSKPPERLPIPAEWRASSR